MKIKKAPSEFKILVLQNLIKQTNENKSNYNDLKYLIGKKLWFNILKYDFNYDSKSVKIFVSAINVDQLTAKYIPLDESQQKITLGPYIKNAKEKKKKSEKKIQDKEINNNCSNKYDILKDEEDDDIEDNWNDEMLQN